MRFSKWCDLEKINNYDMQIRMLSEENRPKDNSDERIPTSEKDFFFFKTIRKYSHGFRSAYLKLYYWFDYKAFVIRHSFCKRFFSHII